MGVRTSCLNGCGECDHCIARKKYYMEHTTWLERNWPNVVWMVIFALFVYFVRN